MNEDAKKKIKDYLSGPRNYAEGVALYNAYGYNRMLKRRFEFESGDTIRAILAEELRKLAGLSPAQFEALPRRARKAAPAPSVATVEKVQPKLRAVPEAVKKEIGFRERFPFLNAPDCPDSLKILVADMFGAHDAYKAAFARMQQVPENENAAELAREVVENYIFNQQAWAELEHYKTTGQILGKAECFKKEESAGELAELDDAELLRRLTNARSNVSKYRKKLKNAPDDDEAATALLSWEAKKTEAENEVARRKKK